MKQQHTITDRELHNLVQEYLGRHPRLGHLAENCAGPRRGSHAAGSQTSPRKPRSVVSRAAVSRPVAGASLLFSSPYRCEPCRWGIEELPVPWPEEGLRRRGRG